jgi:hypothetical protein
LGVPHGSVSVMPIASPRNAKTPNGREPRLPAVSHTCRRSRLP